RQTKDVQGTKEITLQLRHYLLENELGGKKDKVLEQSTVELEPNDPPTHQPINQRTKEPRNQ
ncbi:MAG: hypothetical protein AAF591_12070, partial [Verrucomicrobiota bacterium]